MMIAAFAIFANAVFSCINILVDIGSPARTEPSQMSHFVQRVIEEECLRQHSPSSPLQTHWIQQCCYLQVHLPSHLLNVLKLRSDHYRTSPESDFGCKAEKEAI